MLKNTIMRLIAKGMTEGLADKVSTIYLNGGLTDADYVEIMEALSGQGGV